MNFVMFLVGSLVLSAVVVVGFAYVASWVAPKPKPRRAVGYDLMEARMANYRGPLMPERHYTPPTERAALNLFAKETRYL